MPAPIYFTRADWTDGPDSEAARAARGEGTMLGPLCPVCSEVASGYGDESSPAHTPAVRRVVAWDGGFGLTSERLSAYQDAANSLVKQAWERRWDVQRLGFYDWRRTHWPEERIAKLAAWLRRRDEKA